MCTRYTVPVTNDADAKYVTVRWIATIEFVPNVASQVTPTITESLT